MRPIRNENLAQLLMQMRFTPPAKRSRQLNAVEKLLSIIDVEKEYPFEFVCYRITGHRPKTEIPQQLVRGDQLADDLRILIWKLSGQLAAPVSLQREKVYTTEELAKHLSVSAKTIARWRKKGLMTRKFLFDDGKKRLGFLKSAVDKFLRGNPLLVENAASFKRVTKKEKDDILRRAVALAKKADLSRRQVIDRIARETGRAHETIRAVLGNYRKNSSKKARVLEQPRGVISPADAAELYKLYRQNVPVDELSKRFRRTRSSVYRIISRKRARALLAKKIEFIPSPEFQRPDARDDILAEPLDWHLLLFHTTDHPFNLENHSLPEYIEVLTNTPILNRDTELELFRRYNFLKFLASTARADLSLARPQGRFLEQIESYLEQAETIKKILVEANLPLVVTIANKHTTTGANLLDLVSEGNVSLMNAVEKFDYTKGFRFATYATWAIAKDFARKIPAEALRLRKTTDTDMEELQKDFRAKTAAPVVAIERARHNLIKHIKQNLDDREQYVIISHFALTGTLIRKNRKTLKQIGDDLGLTKERVRQIELVALQKLRQSLSAEEFDLLTG